MYTDKKSMLATLINPVKRFCFVAVLCVSASSFAHGHTAENKVAKPSPGIPLYHEQQIRLLKNEASVLPKFTPADTTISACGSSIVLHSSSIPGFSNPSWNDGSTGTSLTVTQSGTYWWQETGTNIVTNGNFSAGNTGFTSAYTFMTTASPCPGCCCGALSSEGTYSVGTNAHTLHTNFTAFGDHTSGSGKMLIVNGASATNVQVWGQNITVVPNTDYVFSTWVTSVNPASPAILQFSINGTPLGSTINLSSTLADGVWQYFTTTWNSGSNSGTVPIALVNQNTAANGNDFAVDDIVFAPVYRQNVIVNFNPIPVLTLTGPAAACGLYDLTQTITGYDPATYTYIFTDSSGNIISSPQAITQSGVYTVIEQNKVTGCQSLPKQITITINPYPAKPSIAAL